MTLAEFRLNATADATIRQWIGVLTRSGAPIAAALLTGSIAVSVGLLGVFQEQIRSRYGTTKAAAAFLAGDDW
jgi:hypothetical protein